MPRTLFSWKGWDELTRGGTRLRRPKGLTCVKIQIKPIQTLISGELIASFLVKMKLKRCARHSTKRWNGEIHVHYVETRFINSFKVIEFPDSLKAHTFYYLFYYQRSYGRKNRESGIWQCHYIFMRTHAYYNYIIHEWKWTLFSSPPCPLHHTLDAPSRPKY